MACENCKCKQRGGSFRVNGWFALALLAVALVSAATNLYLTRHRALVINYHSTPVSDKSDTYDPDFGVVHAFPEHRDVCTSFNTICFFKI